MEVSRGRAAVHQQVSAAASISSRSEQLLFKSVACSHATDSNDVTETAAAAAAAAVALSQGDKDVDVLAARQLDGRGQLPLSLKSGHRFRRGAELRTRQLPDSSWLTVHPRFPIDRHIGDTEGSSRLVQRRPPLPIHPLSTATALLSSATTTKY